MLKSATAHFLPPGDTTYAPMLPLTQHEQRQNYFYSLSSSALFVAVLMVLGVFFRFANLEKKIYWLDEIGTS
jgi:uncharacterized membrane protein